MVKSPVQHGGTRPPRVKLGGAVLTLLQLENGRHARGKLHQLSVTGGLMLLEKPLDEGIKVEVLFQVGSRAVRSRVRLLFPMWATQGCLQPFEFLELTPDDRAQLQLDLENLLPRTAAPAAASDAAPIEESPAALDSQPAPPMEFPAEADANSFSATE